MELILQKNINNVLVDGFREGTEAYFTRLQIGELLEYDNPQHAIMKIHNRHKERLDQFSRWAQFDTPSGRQEGYVYNIRGVFEICRWSRQPKADLVMDSLYDFAEEILSVGFYSTLPPDELMAAIIRGAEDSEKLEVIIRALNLAHISQKSLVSAYMGMQMQDVPVAITKRSLKNDGEWSKIRNWLRGGHGDFTINDIPQEYLDRGDVRFAIKRASIQKGQSYHFAQVGPIIHFNRYGFLTVIERMRAAKILTDEEAGCWTADCMAGRGIFDANKNRERLYL